MKLHTFPDEFRDLIAIVADRKHLPESAIERDYYIVCLLKNLAESPYAEQCVFRGGTSLSKCYPGSIERFIEAAMTVGTETEKIIAERSNRSKSMYVWFSTRENQIKLEIGSSIRPDLSSAYSYFYDLFWAIVPGLMTLEPSPTTTMGLEEKPGSQSGVFHLIAQAVRMRMQPVWPPSPRTVLLLFLT